MHVIFETRNIYPYYFGVIRQNNDSLKELLKGLRLDVFFICAIICDNTMMKHLVATLILILAPLLLVSCVSSLLKEKAPTFSNEVKYNAPKLPFVRLTKSVYPSWKNKESGNVLSIFSDCQNGVNSSLSELQNIIEDSVESSKRVSEGLIQFQKKPALQRILTGELENNSIQIKSISFKRLNCGYVVSLSGKPEQLRLDENTFDLFIKSLTFK